MASTSPDRRRSRIASAASLQRNCRKLACRRGQRRELERCPPKAEVVSSNHAGSAIYFNELASKYRSHCCAADTSWTPKSEFPSPRRAVCRCRSPTIEEAKKLAAGPYAEQLLLVLFAYAVPLSWA